MEIGLHARAAGIDVPYQPEQLLAAGIPRPQYLPGGNSELVRPFSSRITQQQQNIGMNGLRGIAGENLRGSGAIQPYSFRAFADHMAKSARSREMNAGVLDFVNRPQIQTVADLIHPDLLERMKADALRRSKITQDPSSRILGEMIHEHLNSLDKPYRVLTGSRETPKVGDFDPGGKLNFSAIRPDSVVMPEAVIKAIDKRYAPKGGVQTLFETSNSWMKRQLLQFNAGWHLGDATGGIFMAWLEGGINPFKMIHSMGEVKAMRGTELGTNFERNVVEHPQFVSQGLNMQHMDYLHGGKGGLLPDQNPAATAFGRGFDRFRAKSFKLNETINRVEREAFVLAKLQQKLDGLGLNVYDLGADIDKWKRPDVQAAINHAVDNSNKTMGVFSQMTPFEQKFVRNAFMFWSWTRHISALAIRTSIDNPARMMWALRLGSIGSQNSPDTPEWMKGGINIGGWVIPTNYLNPLNDVSGGSILTDPGRSMSPLLKLGALGVFGTDLSHRGMQLTRPFGTGGYDQATGKATATPLLMPGSFHPLELAYNALNMVPLGRAAINLAPTVQLPFGGDAPIGLGPHRARYGNGTLMVDKSGTPISDDSRLQILGNAFGIRTGGSLSTAQTILAGGGKARGLTAKKAKKVRIGL